MSPYETCQYGLLIVRIYSYRWLRRTPPKDAIQDGPSGIFFKYFRLFLILGIFLAFFIGKFVEHRYDLGGLRSPTLTLIGGAGLFVVGLSLQIFAAHCLGKYFTSRVLVLKDQDVITGGPYRYVRHPGSLGAMLSYYGLSIASNNWLIGALIITFTTVFYMAYIVREDSFLAEKLPHYEAYQKSSSAYSQVSIDDSPLCV